MEIKESSVFNSKSSFTTMSSRSSRTHHHHKYHFPSGKRHVDINKFSYSDARRLAVFRARERRFEKEMNDRVKLARGTFFADRHKFNTTLTSTTDDDLDLVENSWRDFIKNADNNGPRLVIRCLSETKKLRLFLKRLHQGRTRASKAHSLQKNIRVRSLGQHVIGGVSALIANAHNDGALKSYVTSFFKRLAELGLALDDVEALGNAFANYVTLMSTSGDDDPLGIKESWHTFVSDVVRLGQRLVPLTFHIHTVKTSN